MVYTAPRTWIPGEVVTASFMNTQVRDNFKAIGDPWTSYTPVWAASGTAVAIGNGTITGAFMQVGKYVAFRFAVTSGTTTTYGTGNYTISLPVTGNLLFGYPVGNLMCVTGPATPSTFSGRILTSTGSDTVVAATNHDGTRWGQTSPTPNAGVAAQKFAGYGFYEAV